MHSMLGFDRSRRLFQKLLLTAYIFCSNFFSFSSNSITGSAAYKDKAFMTNLIDVTFFHRPYTAEPSIPPFCLKSASTI